jgi:hypothetical protein
MRHSSGFAPLYPLRLRSRVLLLAALCAVFAVVQCMAQAPVAASQPPAVTLPDAPVTATSTAPATDAELLATLSAGSSGSAGLLSPAPQFLQSSTGCTNDYQCLPDKLCCRACAFPGCTAKACLTPMNGHCPLIP